MIHLEVSYKNSFGTYHSTVKKFNDKPELEQWYRDFSIKNKIIGMIPHTMGDKQWNWDEFFAQDPEYIADGSWDNAVYIAKKLGEHAFVDLLERKKLIAARDHYLEINT